MSKGVNIVIGVLIGVLMVVFISIFTIQSANKSRGRIQILGTVPNFEFVNQDGELINERNLRGKITILYFFFTRCPSACPIMATEIQDLYSSFRESDKIQYLAISVDSVHDSLIVLKNYKESLGISSTKLQFLRGDISKVIELSEQGFKLPAENLPAGHSTKFVLIDQNLQIRGYYSSGDPQNIISMKIAIKELALSQITRNGQE